MLKKLVNEAYFTLRIQTTGPLLIKSGYASVSGPDMTPVLTYRKGKPEPFLPGSSLKGVFRSHIEKIVCSIKPRVVCYPFESNDDRQADISLRQQDYRESCGAMFTKRSEEERKKLEEETNRVYDESCPTCRLFGSTWFIGRVAIGDAYLASPDVRERRDGVGIDRLTGGASYGAKFELEVVSTRTVFETDVHLRNFEIWQLGMLFVVMQDMADGLIRIGSGRSRGLGKITAEISTESKNGRPGGLITSTIRSKRGSDEPADQLWGLGRWLGDGSYGTIPDKEGEMADLINKISVARSEQGIRRTRVFTGADLDALRNAAIEKFFTRMEAWESKPLPTAAQARR